MKLSNPVLLKELKLRFRFFKNIVGLIFYLITLLLFVSAYLRLTQIGVAGGYIRPSESFVLFLVLSVIQMCLVMFITPGLTAGSISTEREKQTLNMLLTTTQTSWQIIFGKLTSSLAYLALLLIASFPIFSIVFLFGGVSPGQVISSIVIYFLTMVMMGSVGVMISTLLRKTIPAMITTYGVSIFLMGITAVLFVTSFVFSTNSISGEIVNPMGYFWLTLNPVAAILSITSPEISASVQSSTGIGLPIYYVYIIWMILITITSLLIATKKLRPNMKKG